MPDDSPPSVYDDKCDSTLGSINQPDLSSSLKPRCRAIKDAKQARAIVNTQEEAARERNIKNSRIQAKYNSERPFRQEALTAEGLGWKSNFSTKVLPMLVDKVAPRFVKALDAVKYLTNSSLPDNVPGNVIKTEAFRREITTTIRARPGWKQFIANIAQENALFGFAAVAWLDEFHWLPRFFSQDKFFVPTGTKQTANSVQVIALREDFLIHELFALIEDKEAASTAGWNIENTVRMLNNAMPLDRRSVYSSWERIYEDLIREANVGLSHEAGPLVVSVWHLLAQEVDGKVSHYILAENRYCGKEVESEKEFLFEREDQFEQMSEAIALFAFQHGNGTLHGSKGIGREIYNIAGMLDRTRNEVVDRLNLAGKIIVQADEKALRRFKMSVVGNTILIGQGYQISDRELDPQVEPFLSLDGFLTGLLDQMAGATTPKVFTGERVTKAQVDFFANREEESRDNILARFLSQFADMMSTMQKRLCDPETEDKDAKEMQKRLLEIMDRKELKQLAEKPVAETVDDYTEIERQKIVLAAQESRGNPLYNQREMERRKLTAQFDEEFADAVLLPEEDPTVMAEQTRLQQLELLILVGQSSLVPISPRDNDLVHLQVLMPALESTAATTTQNAGGVEILRALLTHAEQHFEAAIAKGAPKDQMSEIKTTLSKLRSALPKLEEQIVREAQLQEQAGQMNQELQAV